MNKLGIATLAVVLFSHAASAQAGELPLPNGAHAAPVVLAEPAKAPAAAPAPASKEAVVAVQDCSCECDCTCKRPSRFANCFTLRDYWEILCACVCPVGR